MGSVPTLIQVYNFEFVKILPYTMILPTEPYLKEMSLNATYRERNRKFT